MSFRQSQHVDSTEASQVLDDIQKDVLEYQILQNCLGFLSEADDEQRNDLLFEPIKNDLNTQISTHDIEGRSSFELNLVSK